MQLIDKLHVNPDVFLMYGFIATCYIDECVLDAMNALHLGLQC